MTTIPRHDCPIVLSDNDPGWLARAGRDHYVLGDAPRWMSMRLATVVAVSLCGDSPPVNGSPCGRLCQACECLWLKAAR